MKYIILLLLILPPIISYGRQPASPLPSEPSPSPAISLAAELMQEKQYKSAAIEYRRLALTTAPEAEQAGYYWGAAYAYHLNHDNSLAIKMLDYTDETENTIGNETTLLRLDCVMTDRNKSEAEFYADSLSHSCTNQLKHIAQSRKTKLALINHNLKTALDSIPETAEPDIITAVTTYAEGHDKNPKLGGFLGMVPGLGYAYAGEYANALRSLIMNGLFIYAMVETADDDNWGIFSVITFFEITWYTGSIYGGIDSSHRYNQKRLQACIQVIDDQSQYKPDLHKMPAISLKYSF